jgi:hypothetical protein
MAEYRAYIVGADGHFASFRAFICNGDSEAIGPFCSAARLILSDQLWNGHLRLKLYVNPQTQGAPVLMETSDDNA